MRDNIQNPTITPIARAPEMKPQKTKKSDFNMKALPSTSQTWRARGCKPQPANRRKQKTRIGFSGFVWLIWGPFSASKYGPNFGTDFPHHIILIRQHPKEDQILNSKNGIKFRTQKARGRRMPLLRQTCPRNGTRSAKRPLR